MSDFGLIYKRYDSVSALTELLNNSVLALKKKQAFNDPAIAARYPKLAVSDEDVFSARHSIHKTLEDLMVFIDGKRPETAILELKNNALFQSQVLNDDTFQHTIKDIQSKLDGEQELDQPELSALDKFISILDNESTILFRKLRNQRS
jgi:hypothetical protein